VLVASSAAVTASASAATLTGIGSTLVAPIEAEWGASFQAIFGPIVTYDAAGSATGVSAVSTRAVDFGATDAPMSSAQLAACHGCEEIPWALSAVAFGYLP
jgi:phosphate transport system substrate-binding protein